ncbi:hypothetical protein NQ315_014518 [Exocentrus adspersus]|uniref:Uncharacterized protein n=1 Tax=Exocentrus adspersus TaxID=1586481 RepID=A0AAV8V9A3_9CUCU|nr:hypothetical protein NQ315_014518 [Exocentrus adspersus]
MENPCKPNIEEKHYSYARSVESNIKSETPKAEIRHIDCGKKKNGGFGFMKKQEIPPPPAILTTLKIVASNAEILRV